MKYLGKKHSTCWHQLILDHKFKTKNSEHIVEYIYVDATIALRFWVSEMKNQSVDVQSHVTKSDLNILGSKVSGSLNRNFPVTIYQAE